MKSYGRDSLYIGKSPHSLLVLSERLLLILILNRIFVGPNCDNRTRNHRI